MNKIKINKIAAVTALLAFLFTGGHTIPTSAATLPGCYVQGTGSTSVKVDCPTENMARSIVAPLNKCFLSTDPASTRPASSFIDTACTAIVSSDEEANTADPTHGLGTVNTGDNEGEHICGRGPTASDTSNEVRVSFDFGCVGGDHDKFQGTAINPILDIAFAIFRFLSAGAGLVVIGSIIIAGIQYSASRGDPQATGAAIKRIANSLIALLIYIFMFAIANFIVPGGMFL